MFIMFVSIRLWSNIVRIEKMKIFLSQHRFYLFCLAMPYHILCLVYNNNDCVHCIYSWFMTLSWWCLCWNSEQMFLLFFFLLLPRRWKTEKSTNKIDFEKYSFFRFSSMFTNLELRRNVDGALTSYLYIVYRY